MQSLDYHVIDKVLTYDSEIPVYFILPITVSSKNQGNGLYYGVLNFWMNTLSINSGQLIRDSMFGP